MSFIQDMLSVFRKRELRLIERRKEADGVYTFVFEKDQDLTWKPGQYGLFSIAHKSVKNGTKPFSLASVPAENVVAVTTRIGDSPSAYKQAMLGLEPGMTVKMGGPVGGFGLQDGRPSLLIAGGIGITPCRSILKQIASEGNSGKQDLTLLYMDSDRRYIYKDELDEIARQASVPIAYLDAREDLHQAIDTFAASHKNDGSYLVAGPKSMVDAVNDYLLQQHIAKRNIKKDAFWGY